MKVLKYYRDLIRTNSKWILFIALVMLAGFVAGFIATSLEIGFIVDIIRGGLEYLDDLVEDATSAGDLGRVLLIWQNNVVAMGMMLFLGFVIGYVPLFSIFVNGLMLGAVLALSLEAGLGIFDLVLGIAPHGIVEIPCAWLAVSGSSSDWPGFYPARKVKEKKS